jgi:Rrf2 family protein
MFKLSKMSDYGLLLLSSMSEESDLVSTAQLADKTKLSEATVAKLMRLLVKAEIVTSIRGAQGGYALSMRPENVSAEAIITAIDGAKALTACTERGAEECVLLQNSPANNRLHKINGAVKTALQNITLEDLCA